VDESSPLIWFHVQILTVIAPPPPPPLPLCPGKWTYRILRLEKNIIFTSHQYAVFTLYMWCAHINQRLGWRRFSFAMIAYCHIYTLHNFCNLAFKLYVHMLAHRIAVQEGQLKVWHIYPRWSWSMYNMPPSLQSQIGTWPLSPYTFEEYYVWCSPN